jgi:ABC-type glycerol-3-phosphate transport system substrate-binding protein
MMKSGRQGMITAALVILAGFIATQGVYAGGRRQAQSDSGAPVNLTVMVTNSMGNDPKVLRNTKILEQETNTVLEFIDAGTGNEYTNKLNVVMSSGDIPDIFAINNNSLELTYAAEGVLLPLNKHWDKYQNIRKSRSEDIWQVMTHPDGNVYCVPRVGLIGDKIVTHTYWMLVFRQDWLDKAKMSIPRTLDEYWKFCEFIRDGDPDGNGRKDTYAIIGNNGLPAAFEHIFSAYGTQYNDWYIKDGKVVNGSVQPEMKEALKYAARMYAAGFVDPEWVTDSQQRSIDKYQHGMLGAGLHWGHNLDTGNLQGWYEIFQKNVPGAKYAFGDQLLTTTGYTPFGFRKPSPRGWTRTSIYSKSKNLDAALRVLDYSCTPETTLRGNYGIEGETYTKGSDGVIKFFATADQQKEIGISSYMPFIVLTLENQHASKLYQDALLRQNELEGPTSLDDIYLVPEVAQYGAGLNLWVEEQFARFIIGDLDVESGWNNFVSEWNRRGGPSIADAITKVYESTKN